MALFNLACFKTSRRYIRATVYLRRTASHPPHFLHHPEGGAGAAGGRGEAAVFRGVGKIGLERRK